MIMKSFYHTEVLRQTSSNAMSNERTISFMSRSLGSQEQSISQSRLFKYVIGHIYCIFSDIYCVRYNLRIVER